VDFSYDEAMKNCYQCADAGKVRKLAEEVSGV
jgi:copper homeostasis protein